MKNKCFEWWEKIRNKRYVVEINVVKLYLNIVLTPQPSWNVSILFSCYIFCKYLSKFLFLIKHITKVSSAKFLMCHCKRQTYLKNFIYSLAKRLEYLSKIWIIIDSYFLWLWLYNIIYSYVIIPFLFSVFFQFFSL